MDVAVDYGLMPRFVRLAVVLLGGWVAACEIRALHLLAVPVGPVKWLHVVVMGAACLVCVARGVLRREERLAWLLLGAGASAWVLGELYYTAVLWSLSSPPAPSWADAGYLSMPPLTFAGIVVLARSRLRGVPRTLWVDGLTAALAAGAVSAAVVFEVVAAKATGSEAAVATNLAYPITDLLLLGLICGLLAMSGWRLDRTFALIALGVIAFWFADSVFLVKTADGTWVSGGPYDPGWWTLSVMFAAAAWLPRGSVRRVRPGGLISVPIIFAAIAVAVLVAGSVTRINVLAVGFSIGSLGAVLLRLIMTFRAHLRMLQRSQALALSDPLTGLANRRALAQELAERLEANAASPLILASFDLNGFKAYNDAFGHLAGDALLQRLAASLQSAVSGSGTAYRMGGDEFSLLLPDSATGVAALRAAAAALIEHGEGFSIDASVGSVRVPAEAADPELAMKLADERMYLHKRSGRRTSEAQQISRALLAALAHRDPQLGEHVHDVGRLAAATAAALGCAPAVVEAVRVAAELHDVGKVAIPEAILSKPAALNEQEWALMRQHTVAGERILASTTALNDIAPLVRSSHERWDGSGYPDGLAGEQIPLGARIIAVCDAFHAMTSERPYRSAMSRDVALAELQAESGRQFDPRVVDEFVQAYRQGALNAPSDTPLSEPVPAAVEGDPERRAPVETVRGPGAVTEPQAAA